MVGEEECPTLQLGCETTSVVCGAEALDVPGACARRSELMTDLREQSDNEVRLPLALSRHELEAWLQCAGDYAAAEETNAEADATDSDVDLDEDDQLLMNALKVYC